MHMFRTHCPTRTPSADRPRFWSEAECRAVGERVARFARGGGDTTVSIWSTWVGHVRWARNQISTAGDARDNIVMVGRDMNGAWSGIVVVNDVSDASLEAAVRQAEVVMLRRAESGRTEGLFARHPIESAEAPTIFSDATYQLDAGQRADAARRLAQAAADQNVLSAGYVQVSAHAFAQFDSLGRTRYVPFTQAQYSVTVRDPKGTSSGWAGDSHWDWAKLGPDTLTQVALEKCLKSQNPVRVEPGRYTAILEPQAVCDFVGQVVYDPALTIDTMLGRVANEGLSSAGPGPFNRSLPTQTTPGFSRLGERVIDERISVSSDPRDPELGYPQFNCFPAVLYVGHVDPRVFHPVTWIKDGVLQTLSYERDYGVGVLGQSTGLPNPGGFRMSVTGPTHTVDEMVASTKRGLLVTRFDQVELIGLHSTLMRGYTRDGLWLVEDGKVTKPVKNFQFTEGVLAALNSVEQLGVPVRAFHPIFTGLGGFPQPVIVPALKVRDFSFTSLSDAV